jgi:N-methylhydantoinase B
MMPIFHKGRLVSWAAMFGHMTDVGGKVPGSLPTDAKMIYEEGMIVPPTKIYRQGALQEELLTLLLANTRMPEWNKSDFFAIIAALRLAERRVRENIGRFGIDTYISAMADMLDRNKLAMAAIIRMIIPEGPQKSYFEDWIDDDGMGNGPYKIACTLHRDGDVVVSVSTSGSSPALASWLRDRIAANLPRGVGALASQLAALREARHRDGASTEGLAWRDWIDAWSRGDVLTGPDDLET